VVAATRLAAWRTDTVTIATLAMPLILTNFAYVALVTLDILFLGALSPLDLAAGGLALALFNQFRAMGNGLVTGIGNLVADAVGRGRHDELAPLLRAGFVLTSVAGVLFAGAGLLMEHPLIWLGQDPQVAAPAARFLAVAAPGLLPCMGFEALRHFTAGLKQPGPLLAITLVSVALSALLNYGLVFGHFGLPALGLMGVAWTTALVQLLSFAMLTAVALRRADMARHVSVAIWKVWKADPQALRRVWRLGLPIAATYGSEAGFFSVLTLLIGTLGVDALAAQAVVNQIVYIVFMISAGISYAASIHISEACGQAQFARARRLGYCGLALGLAAMAAVAVPYLTMPGAIVALFIGAEQASRAGVAELAMGGLAIAALLQFFDCSQNVGTGLLRGTGDAASPFKLSLVGYWLVGLPMAYVLGVSLHLGVYGVWTGLTLGLAVTAALLVLAFELRLNRLRSAAPA